MSDFTNTILNFLGLARYTSLEPNLSDGESSNWRCDQAGRILVNGDSPNTLWSDGGTSKAQLVVKASAGKLYQMIGRNTGGTPKWIFLYNATTKPADGSSAHLFVPLKVEAGLEFSLDLPRPRAFSTGLVWVASSTDTTLTYDSGATFEIATEYT